MKQRKELNRENFSDLLKWLSVDPEKAGIKYEEVRKGLINYFRFRGCEDNESLADETITRVAMEVGSLDTSSNYETITYFYGFARNIFREYLAGNKRNKVAADFPIPPDPFAQDYQTGEELDQFKCLDLCMDKLASGEKSLVMKYFSKEKAEKLALRKKLAQELRINKGALHTKVHRIKNRLAKCMNKCMGEINL